MFSTLIHCRKVNPPYFANNTGTYVSKINISITLLENRQAVASRVTSKITVRI